MSDIIALVQETRNKILNTRAFENLLNASLSKIRGTNLSRSGVSRDIDKFLKSAGNKMYRTYQQRPTNIKQVKEWLLNDIQNYFNYKKGEILSEGEKESFSRLDLDLENYIASALRAGYNKLLSSVQKKGNFVFVWGHTTSKDPRPEHLKWVGKEFKTLDEIIQKAGELPGELPNCKCRLILREKRS